MYSKELSTRIKSLIYVFAPTLFLFGCNNKGKTNIPFKPKADTTIVEEDTDSIIPTQMTEEMRKHFQKVHDAVVNGDAEAFSSMVGYPIRRSYPLRWIETPEQMVKLFPAIIDDSLKNIMRNIKPEDWQGGGWRGYSFDIGEFWDTGEGIYQINYYSKASLKEKDKLIKEETDTWHPSIKGKNIIPFNCFYDGKTHAVLRLDKIIGKNEDKLRLCVYNDYMKLRGKPDLILDVDEEVQGSAAVQWFKCYLKENGRRKLLMDFYIDYTESYDGFTATIYDGNKTRTHELYRVYWMDLINGRKKL